MSHILSSIKSLDELLERVTPICVISKMASQVYRPVSEVLSELKSRDSSLPVRDGITLISLKESLVVDMILVHDISGVTISLSTTDTSQIYSNESPTLGPEDDLDILTTGTGKSNNRNINQNIYTVQYNVNMDKIITYTHVLPLPSTSSVMDELLEVLVTSSITNVSLPGTMLNKH